MKERKIVVVGLGYVGLPVAVAFGARRSTIGFDVQHSRIEELKNLTDRNGEFTREELQAARLELTSDPKILRNADFFIVAVPTPVNDAHQPDMSLVRAASKTVGTALKRGDIVVYESTVYPGATEEECIPILEQISGLKCGVDFKIGYSPERINPGDKEHSFTNIKKVVSAQDEESLEIVAQTYGSVVQAGVFRAKSIRVAEAAKVIENTQRDLNIALMNELSLIFGTLNIDTQDVLAAARTKWNFLPFQPGLVGGHCIGVDPYYLTYQAERFGYIPQVILAGRRINDSMGKYAAQRMIKEMIQAGHSMQDTTVTVLGLTFKENCKDLRNSRVIDIIRELQSFGIRVQVHDPEASVQEAKHEYGVELLSWEQLEPANGVMLAVAHWQYRELTIDSLRPLLKPGAVIGDLKGVLSIDGADSSALRRWRL